MGCEDSNGRIEHFKKITQIYELFVYVKSLDVVGLALDGQVRVWFQIFIDERINDFI